MKRDVLMATIAAAYYNTAIYTREKMGVDMPNRAVEHWEMMLPTVVNAAFACEVALKAILPSYPKGSDGHDLEKLFLTLKSQGPASDPDYEYHYYLQRLHDNLREDKGLPYEEVNGQIEQALLSRIRENSRDFADARYIFEGGERKFQHNYEPSFLFALARSILEDFNYQVSEQTGSLEKG